MITPREIPMSPHCYEEHKAIVEKILSPLEVEILRAYPNKVNLEGDVRHLVKLMESVLGKEGENKLVQHAAVRILLEDLGVTLSKHDDFKTIVEMFITRVKSYPKSWYQVLSLEEVVIDRPMTLSIWEKCIRWIRG